MFKPVDESPSEMSLGGGIIDKEETNIVNTQISERTEGEVTVPLFKIIFFEVWGRGICGGSVKVGARFCMFSLEEWHTSSHTRSRGSGKYLPGVK